MHIICLGICLWTLLQSCANVLQMKKNPGFVVLVYGSVLAGDLVGSSRPATVTGLRAARWQLGGSYLGLPATLGYVFTAWLHTDSASCGIGVARLPVKITSTLVMADDGGVFGIVVLVCLTSLGLFWGNLRFGSPGSDDDDAFSVVLPSRGIGFKQVLAGGAKKWSGVISTASTAWHKEISAMDARMMVVMSRGVAQQDLSEGWHVILDR